ncbi:hypothetical protein NLI96_g7506 [Meripilus lineatus]|uniref:DUF6533 domain-containing protein n=1 Tax=Meripilus lineatus TaxID=2056292 RepID=A0AAD5V0P7_9APHY|nr:hypothetical protein NLI96_g7506 [Physisporinus lineatus]
MPLTRVLSSHERLMVYADIVAVAIFVWDYLLTIHLEVDYMWPAKWSLVKVLFMLTRYSPIVDLPLALFLDTRPRIPVEACHILFLVRFWSATMGISIAWILLALRTWAIWGRGKRLGCALVVVYIGCSAPTLVFEKILLDSTTCTLFSPPPHDSVDVAGTVVPKNEHETMSFGCMSTRPYPTQIVIWGLVMVTIFETFVIILTLVNGFRKGSFREERIERVGGRRSVVVVLYRDGFLYFIYLFCITLVNIIMTAAIPGTRGPVNLLTLQRVMHSCLGARVLFNLRKAHKVEFYGVELSGLVTI